MATAELDWRRSSESRGDNNRVVESYIILDATSRGDAFAATGFPAFRAPYQGNSLYRAMDRQMTQEGPTTYRGTVTYRWINLTSPGENPLDDPPVISWNDEEMEVPADADALGRPITNSAGDFFDPPFTRTINVLGLTIRRNEPFYDLVRYRRFWNTVNSNQFTLGDILVRPRECLCKSIRPASEYTADADFIPILYQFKIIYEVRTSANANGFPWDYHIPNIGARGIYEQGKLGTLVDAQDIPVGPTKLFVDGTPVNSGLFARKPDGTRVSPVAAGGDPPIQSPFSTANSPILLYYRYPEANFADLNL